jgi:type IV pilus assembly protein PilW
MRARGFTLVELAVAMVVSSVVILGAVVLVNGTQRLFLGGAVDRAMQETARVALDEITRSVRAAGYGLDPTFTFDFGQATSTMDRLGVGQTPRFGGYACASNVTCRDRITGPDELVFYARDPSWGRDLSGNVSTGSITLSGDLSTLSRGQILQVMCYGVGNKWLWAYVTVSNVTTASGKVDLVAATGEPNDFPFQNERLGDACFGSGQRRAYKIDRYRYYVETVDASGTTQAWGTAGARPYLMLDQGLTDSSGNAVRQVIAPDVEDLQVAYVFPLGGSTADSQLVGATSGTAIGAGANGIDLAPALGLPTFATPTLDPIRTTHHPANIRAVRVAVTVRSSQSDASVTDATVPPALNRPAVAGEAGYRRMVFEATGATHNLEARLPVFPIYDPTYTTTTCAGRAGNCGGG